MVQVGHSSLAVVPRRGRLLAAKLALVGAVAAAVGTAVSLAVFLVGRCYATPPARCW